MTTRVYLARHGTTVSTEEDRFAGETDVALSDLGRRDARALGARLKGRPIAAFYASSLRRALETARLVAEPHGMTVVPRPELREMSHGRWEGKTRAQVRKLYPDEYARWEADPFSFAPEGGETGRAVSARALPALLEIVAAHQRESVLIVSHKATIRLLVCALIGLDGRTYRNRLDQSPACLNVLDFASPSRPRLMLFNDTSHCGDAASKPGAEAGVSG